MSGTSPVFNRLLQALLSPGLKVLLHIKSLTFCIKCTNIDNALLAQIIIYQVKSCIYVAPLKFGSPRHFLHVKKRKGILFIYCHFIYYVYLKALGMLKES